MLCFSEMGYYIAQASLKLSSCFCLPTAGVVGFYLPGCSRYMFKDCQSLKERLSNLKGPRGIPGYITTTLCSGVMPLGGQEKGKLWQLKAGSVIVLNVISLERSPIE